MFEKEKFDEVFDIMEEAFPKMNTEFMKNRKNFWTMINIL